MLLGERHKFVLFQEVVNTCAQGLGDYANVVERVKPVRQIYTFTGKGVSKINKENDTTIADLTADS
jgi:hypothetical protein